MSKINLYIDQDGVTANWGKRVIHELARFESAEDFNKHPKSKEIQKDIYSENPHIFLELEVVEPFKILSGYINAAMKVYDIEVKVLTALGITHHDPEIVKSDKIQWLKKHKEELGLDLYKNFISVPDSGDKVSYADEFSILIDDYDKNCIGFSNHGGYAICTGEGANWDPHKVGKKLMDVLAYIDSHKFEAA